MADASSPAGPTAIESNESTRTTPVSPISLVLVLCAGSNEPLSIDGLDKLPLHQQLEILNPINTESRNALILKLCAELPALRDSESNKQRFQFILSKFYEQCIALNAITPSEWDKNQISFSLLCYAMDQLRRKPVTDDDRRQLTKDLMSAQSMWQFIHYLMKYCDDNKWDGMELNKYWNETTGNGQNTKGFALKFTKLICTQYGQKLGKYARIRKMFPVWYLAALGVDSEHVENVSDDYHGVSLTHCVH